MLSEDNRLSLVSRFSEAANQRWHLRDDHESASPFAGPSATTLSSRQDALAVKGRERGNRAVE
jgi:hypothetical protein